MPAPLSIRLFDTSLSHDVDIEGAVGQAKLSGSGKREGLATLDQGVVLLEKRLKKATNDRI